MMLAFQLIIYLFLSCFLHIEGYLFFIKSSGNNSACITNETDIGTIAFVKDPASYNVNPRPALPFKDLELNFPSLNSSYNCDLAAGFPNNCRKWNTEDFHVLPNFNPDLDDEFDPVSDIRWHRFRNVVTDHPFRPEQFFVRDPLTQTKVRFHTSVLAKDSAQFHFSPTSAFDRGYLMAVDGWVGKRTSKLRYCYIIPKNDPVSDCTEMSVVQKSEYLKKGNTWTILTNEFTTTETNNNKFYYQEFRLTVNNNITVFNESDPSAREMMKFVGVKSFQAKATFKLHAYTYLKPKETDSKMTTKFTLYSPETVCFDIIYISPDEGIEVQLGNSHHELEKTHATTWSTKRILQRLEDGEHTIILSAKRESSLIGGVYFCTGKTTFMKSSDTLSRSCELLGRGNNDLFITSVTKRNFSIDEQHPLTLEETKALCKAVGKTDCYQVEICDFKGCFCISGYMDDSTQTWARCQKKCISPFYGPDCAYYDRYCNTSKYDYNTNRHHDGVCANGCKEEYRIPDCKERILYFQSPPNITALGPNSAEINFGPNDFQKSEHFSHVYVKCYDFLGEDTTWQNGFERNFSQTESPIVLLEGLDPQKNYSCLLRIFEKDGQRSENQTRSDFRTKCVPLNEKNLRVTFEKPAGIKLLVTGDRKHLCHLEKFEIMKKDRTDKHILFPNSGFDSGGYPEYLEFVFEPGNSYIVTILSQDEQEYIIEHKEIAEGSK